MAMMMPMPAQKPPLGRQLADRLEALRQAHGLTQGQLAYKAKVDKSTVYIILAGGRKDPPIGTVMKFAEAFGVGLDELVGLKPLHVPEMKTPESDTDRLAALEAKVERLVTALAPALEQAAEQAAPSEAPQRSAGTRQRRSPAQRKPA